MRPTRIAPTGTERSFGDEEVIVTKTDTRGRITYANDVFLRVSAYAEHEVLGQPHSLVRHPAMPRCVFRLLWDGLEREEEVFAYIRNLAGDGAHYWVFAHVTPSRGADGSVVGYHSNRRRPTRAALERVAPLYERLLQEEQRHPRTADAVAASTAMLHEHAAAEAGDYDAFVWSLEPESPAPHRPKAAR